MSLPAECKDLKPSTPRLICYSQASASQKPGHGNFQPFFPFICAKVPCVCPQLRRKPRQAESLKKLPPSQAEVIQTRKKKPLACTISEGCQDLPTLRQDCMCVTPAAASSFWGIPKQLVQSCLAWLRRTPSSPVYQTPEHTQRKS